MPASALAWIGRGSLIAALIACLLGVVAYGRAAARSDRSDPDGPGARAKWLVWAAFGLVSAAVGMLWIALLAGKFELVYVAGNVSRSLPPVYRITALWAGQAGSLLFWLWLTLGYAAWIARRAGRMPLGVAAPALAVLCGIGLFFTWLVAFVANPFVLQAPPPDGRGLNPLLQSYWMALHPVFLYLGYVGLAVPFSFAVGALWQRRLGPAWMRVTRRFTIVAWLFLSVGILLGARWAYEELGWGGYWAWDPVENASFMPWLVATAFLHSVIIEEKRGMLRRWNVGLIGLTYALTIFGTFLTRSGILASVHAFAVSDIGPWIIGYLGAVLALFLYLFLDRSPLLADLRRPESLLSKESSFLLNNLLFVGAAFAVFWGTVFPLAAGWFDRPVTVAAPYFNRVTAPLFLALLALMGVGPLIAWRRATPANLRRNLSWPLAVGTLAAVWITWLGVREPGVVGTAGAFVFVVTSVLLELARATLVRIQMKGEGSARAMWRVVNRNPRRYGGYLVHVGIACMAVGIAASSGYQREVTAGLRPGEHVTVGPYQLTFEGLRRTFDGSVPAIAADLAVSRGGAELGVLAPKKRFYPEFVTEMGPTTEVAIRTSGLSDLYVILAGWDESGSVVGIKAYFNPLIGFLWLGGLFLIGGVAFSLWPRAARADARVDAHLAALADLEYDYRMDKLAAADYQALRERLTAAAAAAIEQESAAIARVRRELTHEEAGR